MKTTATITMLLIASACALAETATPTGSAPKVPATAPLSVPKDIKAYDLDFNWGPGGPNAFAKPGLWADADPAAHVAWYKTMGANVIQTFCVSCNGYAWYKNGTVPEQPGLKHDFLPEVVKLAHQENMLVLGYFCAGSNTRWGQTRPELSYGFPNEPHIPYTDEYLAYLDAAIRDAVGKTGIDGFMVDWLRMPTSRKSNGNRWLECEKKLYTQLMGEPFPGEQKITPAKMTECGRRAVDRCWQTIRKAAKETNPNCIVWLTCCDVNDPHIANSRALKETDWLLNEAGDLKRTADAKRMIGPQTRLITCLAEWNQQDPMRVVPAALKEGIGLYGFARPAANSLLPLETLLARSAHELSGNEKNIAALARAFHGASLNSIRMPDGTFIEPLAPQKVTASSMWKDQAGYDPACAMDGNNIVWDSPSKNHSGSMPLGNGDISLNAWVEPSGDLCFYIGKTDSWDDNARLLKVGKVRVTFDPPLSSENFRQELKLQDGAIEINSTIRLWVDANHPVIHITADRSATAAIELWRTKQETLPKIECSDALFNDPQRRPTIVEPDVILTAQKDRIGWYHRNIKSVGPQEHAEIQGMSGYQRQDPLLHRTFGALITAPNAKRLDDTHLQSPSGSFAITVHTQHPATPEQWLAEIEKLPVKPDFDAHKKWWADFWSRSWIQAKSNAGVSLPVNNHPLRTGIDQHGSNKFAGEIRNAKLPDNLTGGFTLEAEVKPGIGATGRIFDKVTPGTADGFLLDLLSGNTLRLVVGSVQHSVKNVLPEGAWSKVAVVASAESWRVNVNGKTVLITTGSDDAAYVSQMYALQRFITACAGRGRYPIKFNGSLFTVPYPGRPGDADYRAWGPGYWWQNTRLPYLSLCASGDFEMMEPLFRMYVDELLPLNKYRTKKYFGFDDAAYYIECIQFWGDVFLETYGWTPVGKRQDPLQTSGYHKWEWVAGPELVWMMLDNYEHTGNEALLKQRIIPTADAVMRFFDNYYKTNATGQLVMHPSMACETWWDCTNPMPELAGLRAITARLLALPESATPPASRAFWKMFMAKLAPLPTRDTPSGKALAPAATFANKRNCENPELYAVFPFRLCSFEKDNRDLGINALKHRWDRGNFGWCQEDIFMAYLGLANDARQSVVGRARNSDKGSRFPAFWGPNYDWIPDQDHGGVLMKAFQAMLMQSDGDKIFLLPAWPKDWDVSVKLHAPKQTTVEYEVKNGRVTKLVVTPESRRKDVEICEPFVTAASANHPSK